MRNRRRARRGQISVENMSSGVYRAVRYGISVVERAVPEKTTVGYQMLGVGLGIIFTLAVTNFLLDTRFPRA